MSTIEVEREEDGRGTAEVVALPGAMAYGSTREEAIDRARAVSPRILADRIENGESVPALGHVFAVTP